jgi:nucleoside-diphosphate-sugar epimerase
MHVFLTGATGHIGSAVLDAFLRGGHLVTALVRDPEKGNRFSQRGVHALVGDLSNPDIYVSAAESCDAIVHAAFDHTKQGSQVDRLAIDGFLAASGRRAARGEPGAFVYTSSLWVLGDTPAPAAEDSLVRPTPLVAWRHEHEQIVLEENRHGGRTVVVRPGTVYGGGRGIIADLLKDAANGLVRVIGSGKNHWPCVYDRDLADLYVRLTVDPDASGVFHANDEADELVDDIVEAIARHVKTRPDVRHMPIEEARAKMGPYADALALDQLVRSPRARALGWTPLLHSVAGNAARLLEEFRAARAAA